MLILSICRETKLSIIVNCVPLVQTINIGLNSFFAESYQVNLPIEMNISLGTVG
jgi:hypothetical protein